MSEKIIPNIDIKEGGYLKKVDKDGSSFVLRKENGKLIAEVFDKNGERVVKKEVEDEE